MFTRQGHSPNVKFPRILGIEATGLVEEAPGGEFQRNDVVATAMGEMGRAYDGGYVRIDPLRKLRPTQSSADTVAGGVYMRPSKTGPEAENQLTLGSSRSLRRDAPNGIRLAVQRPPAQERRNTAHPRRHDQRRPRGIIDRCQPRRHRSLHKPQRQANPTVERSRRKQRDYRRRKHRGQSQARNTRQRRGQSPRTHRHGDTARFAAVRKATRHRLHDWDRGKQ